MKNWCTISPVKYSDPFRHLKVPFRFANGVILDEIPDWLRQPKFTDNLSFAHRAFINSARYALCVHYDAPDLGTLDPSWSGKDKRSIQDARHEAINLANVAIWLSNPCSFGFDVVFHIDEFQTTKNLRLTYQVRDLEPHIQYYRTYLQQTDLSTAKLLHSRIFKVKRNSSIWIGLYTLWNALREPEWGTRYTLFWIGLESLFGPEDGKEITFRLSQRVAFFLGKSRKERLEKFQKAKELYTWRSKVVHGLRLSKLIGSKSIQVSFDTEMLLRESLVKILRSRRLIEEFTSRREQFLDSLAFK